MIPTLFYATDNSAKFHTVRCFMEGRADLISPADVGVVQEVEETGQTLEENAFLKARAYNDVAPSGAFVVGDDTGFEIAALGGEPGVHVRRWRDKKTRMSDEEVIQHCLERMRGIKDRRARFRTVLGVVTPDGEEMSFEATLEGAIAEEDEGYRLEGFPLRSLFWIPERGKFLYQTHATHREDAFGKLLDWIESVNSLPS